MMLVGGKEAKKRGQLIISGYLVAELEKFVISNNAHKSPFIGTCHMWIKGYIQTNKIEVLCHV